MSLGAAYVAIKADLAPLAKGLKIGRTKVTSTLGKMGQTVVGLGKKLLSL